MTDIGDKENMSPLRLRRSVSPAKTSSPPKPTKKARSKSIGPGGLEELESAKQKSPKPSRRRSAMTQIIQLPPKGILPSKDEAQKRKEARRKSLAARRVSFAPEATLHTWDVIEHMRDATTSSASSENSRRASATGAVSLAGTPARQVWEPDSDPPSTPPEQADDDDDLPTEPEHQRNVHQKKRRRSSAIPPMNFNDPNDDFSSSPVSGSSSIIEGSSDVEEDDVSDDDGESTAMSLDAGDNTLQSEETESTDSSLTARLRQASQIAGTRGMAYDEYGEDYDEQVEEQEEEKEEEEEEEEEEEMDDNGELTMDMVTQELTHSFKPWAQQSYGPPQMAKNIIALQDQENMNPFSPAFRSAYSHRKPHGVPSTVGEETEIGSEDMSMDMTRVVGGILHPNSLSARQSVQYEEDENTAMTMDMTRAVGGILQPQPQQSHQPPHHDQEDNTALSMDITHAIGAILQPDIQSHDNDMSMDMTMEMTRAIGGILPPTQADEDTLNLGDGTMDFTQAIGKIIQPQPSRVQPPRSALKRKHVTTDQGSPATSTNSPLQPPQRRTAAQVTAKRRRSSAQRSSLGDATMDFTMAVGRINKDASPNKQERRAGLRRRRSSGMSSVMDEQTMDFTTAVGGIRQPALSVQQPIEEEGEEAVDENEELSMDFTAVIGGTKSKDATLALQRPATPRESLSPARTEVPTTPNHEGHFREVQDKSAKKLLTPVFEEHVQNSAVKDSVGPRRSSARKSVESPVKSPSRLHKSPASPEKKVASRPKNAVGVKQSSASIQQTPASTNKTPVFTQDDPASAQKTPVSTRKSPASARKTPISARKSPASARKRRQNSIAAVEETSAEDGTSAPAEELTQSFSPVREQEQPDALVEDIEYPALSVSRSNASLTVAVAAEDIVYPELPAQESAESLFQATPAPATNPRSHNPPMVSEAGSPLPSSVHTPEQINLETVNPLSPSVEKQLRSSPIKKAPTPQQSAMRSATPHQPQSSLLRQAVNPQQPQSSPVKEAVTPQQSFAAKVSSMTPQQIVSFEEPSRAFSNSLKKMSTPRKDSGTTPLKRLRGMTPMKSPAKKPITPRKAFTPKAKTPQIASKPSMAELAGQQLAQDLFAATKAGQQIPKVKLNDFLDMAGIKFMELALPTKRRYTVAPTPGRAPRNRDADGDEDMDNSVELESAVVAGACTMPMLELFQHSCRELKRYISEGKSFVKTLESEVYAEPPPLISGYVSGSPQRKSELDAHMRDAKTNARLRSKEIWYNWRSQLLDGLEAGLKGVKSCLENDGNVLSEREKLLESFLPDLLAKHETLESQALTLEEAAAAAATSEEEKEELNATREQLVNVNAQIEERKCMLASLKKEIQEQESLIEEYGEGKAECMAQIQEAERVKDSCRGWSIDEIASLKASVTKIENQTGWTIASASSSTLTMTYRTTLSLFFDTAAFLNPGSSTAPKKSENQPISLTYLNSNEPLSTEKRFFLQLIRAQLQCLEQRTTSIKTLLRFVSSGWDIATHISEATRRLRIEHPVAVNILSDERLGVQVDVLLPKVQTKVRLDFELSAAIVNGENGGCEVGTHIAVNGKVVYGEGYNEKNMEGFLSRRCGVFGEGWDDAVRELRVKLVATGRKG
ncbi:Spc7 kinetochore protein-domain-containing protein [Delphinella strobiligena]|nr:Spc7 kinetochore protein-domain-containing protein [Delphinella strobiligena]